MEQHSHLTNYRTQVSTDSADSVLPLSILMEVRVLEHGTGVTYRTDLLPRYGAKTRDLVRDVPDAEIFFFF